VDPFSGDLFDRKKIADRLTGFVSRLPEGGVFAIDAPWGEGKSWFGRHWHAELVKSGFRSVYLDAFASDYVEDPFLMLSGELLAVIKDDSNAASAKVAEAGKRLSKTLLPIAAKIAVNAAGRILLGSADLSEEFKSIGEKVQEGAADALEKQIEARLESYAADKKSVDGFKAALTELAQSNDKPIVIFIDELDRCRPDFAVKTIERVKHFFDVPGLVFVLLLNRAQLCESIKGIYGGGLDADAYLGKFIQFSLTLPKQRSFETHGRDDNRNFCSTTLARYGFTTSAEGAEGFASAVGAFANLLNMSLRDIEQAVVLFSLSQPLYKASMFVAWPIVVKIKLPGLYSRILSNELNAHAEASTKLADMRIAAPNFWALEFWNEMHDGHVNGFKEPLGKHAAQVLQSIGTWGFHADRFMPMLFHSIDLNVIS
jgi:hypothetical protein